MDQPVNSANLNWTFWILILLGNGLVMTLVTLFQQWLFHRQNFRSDKEKHKQNIELEEKKRSDYLICKNYDELFEIAKILNQILLTWWLIVSKSEENKGRIEANLWDYECPIHEKFKTEATCFARLVKQYEYLIPREVSSAMGGANREYKKDNFEQARKLIIDAKVSLNNLLGIKKSQEEIRKRFDLIAK